MTDFQARGQETATRAADVSLLEQSAALDFEAENSALRTDIIASEARSQEGDEVELLPPTMVAVDLRPLILEPTGVSSHVWRGRQASTPKLENGSLWEKRTIWKFSVAAKLREVGQTAAALTLEECHSRRVYAECTDCRRVSIFLNRCDRFYCPECQPKLARNRARSVEWWARTIQQPKHVVLTARNTDRIDRHRVAFLKGALAKLRRSAFARNWRGGFWALETTNEGQGWHLHFHLLVDAPWIDAAQLAREWGKRVGQEFAIVKVMDGRQKDYLRQVTKYACKGSDIAKWPAQEISDFIAAFSGGKSFGVFGSLYGKRTEFADWLESIRDHKPRCECGCDNLRFLDENEWHAEACRPATPTSPRPPPSAQTTFNLGITPHFRHAILAGH